MLYEIYDVMGRHGSHEVVLSLGIPILRRRERRRETAHTGDAVAVRTDTRAQRRGTRTLRVRKEASLRVNLKCGGIRGYPLPPAAACACMYVLYVRLLRDKSQNFHRIAASN